MPEILAVVSPLLQRYWIGLVPPIVETLAVPPTSHLGFTKLESEMKNRFGSVINISSLI